MFAHKIQKLVTAALFVALTAMMTMAIRIPSPLGGYVNLGDCAVLLAAWVLGPVYGCAAAGVGSMLADLIGYPLYAPGTLVIKGGMALIAGWIFQRTTRREEAVSQISLVFSGAAAEAAMVIGYFLYEALPFPLGLGVSAAINIPFNFVQGTAGLASAEAVYLLLFHRRRKYT